MLYVQEIQHKKAIYDLAFGVHVEGNNTFSAKMIKLKDGKISEWKHGNGTSLGHAVAIAEGLLTGYALVAHEVSAEQYYDEARVI